MTDRSLGDSELDAAIDRAVRDLMGAEPRADLRERVLSELAARPSWPGPRRAPHSGRGSPSASWRPPPCSSSPSSSPIGRLSVPPNSPSPACRHRQIARGRPARRSRVHQNPRRNPTPHTGTQRPDRCRLPRSRSAVVDDRPIQAASIETAPPLGVAPTDTARPAEPDRTDRSVETGGAGDSGARHRHQTAGDRPSGDRDH